MARGLKSGFQEVEGLYYLCRENKRADQLLGYCVVDLCLWFCIYIYAKHDAAHLEIFGNVMDWNRFKKFCLSLGSSVNFH